MGLLCFCSYEEARFPQTLASRKTPCPVTALRQIGDVGEGYHSWDTGYQQVPSPNRWFTANVSVLCDIKVASPDSRHKKTSRPGGNPLVEGGHVARRGKREFYSHPDKYFKIRICVWVHDWRMTRLSYDIGEIYRSRHSNEQCDERSEVILNFAGDSCSFSLQHHTFPSHFFLLIDDTPAR